MIMGECPDCPKADPPPSRDHAVVGWRMWWEDNAGELRELTSHETDLSDLPETGFQGMVLYYANGTRRILSGSTWFFFATHPKGMIYGHGEDQPTKAVYPGLFKVCRGRWMPDQANADLQHVMQESSW